MKKKGSEQQLNSRFTSRSEHALDPKGRLNIPSRYRNVLRAHYSEELCVTNWHNCIKAYPVSVWNEIEQKLETKGRNKPGFDQFMRYVMSGLTPCTLDKQGRILVPATLRTLFGIEKDVVLNGMLDHFEIWDKRAWEEEMRKTRENFPTFNEGLSSLGIY